MLVLVASCYLICNVLNVVVTGWEFFDMVFNVLNKIELIFRKRYY